MTSPLRPGLIIQPVAYYWLAVRTARMFCVARNERDDLTWRIRTGTISQRIIVLPAFELATLKLYLSKKYNVDQPSGREQPSKSAALRESLRVPALWMEGAVRDWRMARMFERQARRREGSASSAGKREESLERVRAEHKQAKGTVGAGLPTIDNCS
jgi:hypothetical protein